MSYKELVDKGFLKKHKFKPEQIAKTIARARQDIESSELLINQGFEVGAYKIAYEAMLLAGRALVFSYGYRPRIAGSHKIVVDFSTVILGKEYQTLVKKFDRMRKKRHDLVYEAASVSKTEAQNAIKTATTFIEEIKTQIPKRNPQQKLF